MSIATAIAALQQAKEDIADAIEAKGVITTGHGLADFADDIADIPTGGGGTDKLDLLLIPNASGVDIDLSGLSITAIPYYAFARKSTVPGEANGVTLINQVKLPSTLTHIYDSAFAGHARLTVYGKRLPASLTSISASAFSYCSALELEELPASLTSIATTAFQRCSALALLSLPSNLTDIGSSAFSYCAALKLRTIPAGVQVIQTSAFEYSGIEYFDIPSTCMQVNNYAFRSCNSLETLLINAATLGNGNTSVACFRSCTALKNVWIGEDCTKIFGTSSSSRPFDGCTALTDIYCEADSKPADWSNYWNYISASTQATVHWGVSRAEAEAIFAGE